MKKRDYIPPKGYQDVVPTSPGRPTKCTPELIDEICKAIRGGNHILPSALYAGISQRTFEKWMKRGNNPRERDPIFGQLVREIGRALADAEVRNVSTNQRAALQGDVKAAQWWLTHGPTRKRWRRTDQLEVSGEGLPAPSTTIVIGGGKSSVGQDLDKILEERRRRKLGHGDKKQIEYVGSQELPGEEDG